MKTIWRSAAAALVLASTCSIPSFGQQYHDEDNGPSYGEGHRCTSGETTTNDRKVGKATAAWIAEVIDGALWLQ